MKVSILCLALGMLLGYGASVAHTQTPGSPDRGVQPIRLIDRDEVRVSRVELEAGAVRSVHAHTDVLYHLWVPLAGSLRLTINGQTIEAKPGEAYFMANGTSHGFANVGNTPGAAMEIFVKDYLGAARK